MGYWSAPVSLLKDNTAKEVFLLLSFYSPSIALFSLLAVHNRLLVPRCYHGYLIQQHGKEAHFYEKENAATELLLHRMDSCAIFYVNTANNGSLLLVLACHLHTQTSLLYEDGAQVSIRCCVAPRVHSPSLGQVRRARGTFVAQLPWNSETLSGRMANAVG